MDVVRERRGYRAADVLLYLAGVSGLAACLTLVWLGMRAVMNVGGFCAEGGPYVIETPCPEGVPLVMMAGIFGLFLFGGLIVWKGSAIGGPYPMLVALAWPVLFLSLGWNFIEFALRPPAGEGIVLGWLIPGVIFVLMGGVPLIAVLPIGHSGRAGSARSRVATGLATRVAPGDPRAAGLQRLATDLRAVRDDAQASADVVDKLERLAALRRSGDLTELEYEQAKRTLLGAN